MSALQPHALQGVLHGAMTQAAAHDFATRWVAAWNAHDLEAILAFYASDVVFSSPIAAKAVPNSDGRLFGTASLRTYWSAGLRARPSLHFALMHVACGIGHLVLVYRNQEDMVCAESFAFAPTGLIAESHAHHVL
jgi:hypothetical protein